MKRAIRKTAVLLTLAALLTGGPSRAFAEGYAGRAGAFLRMGAGAIALGAGDAGVARAMGTEQAHYNPAGLPFAPGNDISLGYHALSLDRRLAHVGALYQIPQIALWRAPMVPVLLPDRKRDGPPVRLQPLERIRRTAGRQLAVEDYLPALSEAILAAARDSAWTDTTVPAAVLELDGRRVQAGVLTPVVRELVPVVRRWDDPTDARIREELARRHQDVRKKPAAVALRWTHAGTDEIAARNSSGLQYATLGYYENRFSLSFGLRVHPALSVGVTAGVLYALVPDVLEDGSGSLTSTTFGVDVGMQLRPFYAGSPFMRLNTLVLGAAAYDLGARNSWDTTGYWSRGVTRDDDYPDRYRVGAAWSPRAGVQMFLDLETDMRDLLRPKGGVEVCLFGPGSITSPGESPCGDLPDRTRLMVRAGVDRDRPTFGLGLMLDLLGMGMTRLDYAFVADRVSPEPTQVISWRFLFTL